MKKYFALIAKNNQTEVIEISAKNMNEAKSKASLLGQVICVSLESGSKIYF